MKKDEKQETILAIANISLITFDEYKHARTTEEKERIFQLYRSSIKTLLSESEEEDEEQ